MDICEKHANTIGTAVACRAFGVPRSSFYRSRKTPIFYGPRKPRATSKRALSALETAAALEVLHSEEYVDKAPAQIWAGLLDAGKYLCSIRTMYRILHANAEVRDRRNQSRHHNYSKPELLATQSNQVWSWDITKLKGPAKWTYFYLYVILDIFSRYVVGWMVANRESSALAEQLISETIQKQNISADQLTLHADRGSSMKSKTVALLLADLGVNKSHSRPHVSDDNPFSEAQFKTLKYHPEFPEYFGSIQDSRDFNRTFFNWYNNEHYHFGINLLTPAMVHYGESEKVIEKRQVVLDAAFQKNPERWVKQRPHHSGPPTSVWINPPKTELVV